MTLFYTSALISDTPKEVVVYTFSGNTWRRNYTVCNRVEIEKLKGAPDFQRNFLKSPYWQIPIYINDPKYDYASQNISAGHHFEPWAFNSVHKYIRDDSTIDLVDCGAHVGVISLQVARLGRKVIAVEPTVHNTRHLCASTEDNGLQDRITIIHNALSNNHKEVSFVLPDNGEYALGFVDNGNDVIKGELNKRYGDIFQKRKIHTKVVTLDDLLNLSEFKTMSKVFIKMDAQGYERPIVEGADKLFKSGRVTGFYIEWTYHKNQASGDYIERRFKDMGMESYDCNGVLSQVDSDLNTPCTKVDIRKTKTYGDDVIWAKK